MTDFLSDSFCRGLRPRHLPQFAVESRRFLVARLMKAHHQPCFLVAPAGFGKSLLADQFASLMFSYWRTFWLDCQDLRFIRLLDEDALVEGIFQRDEHPALVVFDDLPTLSQQQAQKFCRCILSLQEAGCRVLACMTPVCFDEEYDCVNPLVITGKSMLVQSSERLEAASSQLFPEPFCRIPLLAREGEQGVAPLLRGLAFDEFTFQELLVALCLCALGRGSLALLERIFSQADLSLCLRTL